MAADCESLTFIEALFNIIGTLLTAGLYVVEMDQFSLVEVIVLGQLFVFWEEYRPVILDCEDLTDICLVIFRNFLF